MRVHTVMRIHARTRYMHIYEGRCIHHAYMHAYIQSCACMHAHNIHTCMRVHTVMRMHVMVMEGRCIHAYKTYMHACTHSHARYMHIYMMAMEGRCIHA